MEASLTKVIWPKRATVTAGMPYGNKGLHFGHIGGVFVPADCFARFLRDRIGKENVRFVSGTDCYGSPIDEGYRKALESGEFEGSIVDYVRENHERQRATLSAYGISLSIYEGSGIGYSAEMHQQLSKVVVEKLHASKHLNRQETLQFYDNEADMFLTGRQVLGRCPVQACKSEHAYADECDLGHQYDPKDLIAPVSTVTGAVPELRPVANWYFDLPGYQEFLKEWVKVLEADDSVRPLVPHTIKEFLAPPIIYVRDEEEERYLNLADRLPEHTYRPAHSGKRSFEIEFRSIEERDTARELLVSEGLRLRTGKTLVPFRISGNAEWGVNMPILEGDEGLTIWCWPESLWAPISFSMALNDRKGLPRSTWKDFWCSDDALVYQFIGQDNLYFYGVAQPALFEALSEHITGDELTLNCPLKHTKLIANYHMLFGSKKASSSGAVKPPSADELLEHYNFEQLRAHFLALGLSMKSVGFKPKAFDPDDERRSDPRVADPALKESALLTNIFNRLARSCFYEAQKNFEGYMPLGKPSPELVVRASKELADYDATMYKVELHTIMSQMDDFLRWSNKYWTEKIGEAEKSQDTKARRQVLIDSFYLLRICTLLMHPIVPSGTEKICEYLCFDPEDFFSWNYDFENMDELCSAGDIREGRHRLRELPPRTDFFKKHP